MKSEHFPSHQFTHSVRDCNTLATQLSGHSKHPFYNHQFLSLLEESGCLETESGWQPYHLNLEAQEQSLCLPGYLKHHSYGEYVFDWDIAQQLQRAGIRYYPKWVAQLPFTPVEMPLPETSPLVMQKVSDRVQQELENLGLFMGQLLYLPQSWTEQLVSREWILRHSIQFLWRNRDYTSFEDFLSQLKLKRRKNIRAERKKIAQSQLTIERCTGDSITADLIAAFVSLYQSTYLKKSGHLGYLNASFFERWLTECAEQCLLVVARENENILAMSCMTFDDRTLYGRYWGILSPVTQLHFECCYYQGIEFCIERGLQAFHPGVQGEHKVTRGFEAELSSSFYFTRHDGLNQQLKQIYSDESLQLSAYRDELNQRLPFKT
ncbi:GNAT family N-acetyltransferase [Pleionea sp. CnH1-48]|uniref:GNAT family N-acetyltransferase n=1 Tax=Pleionea sp. CnH1-48 TaxID=2954494 RepID=UPI0020978BBD|nr:GNAT family N-acetyltransferase [Pleionea sp. CnH1-48]MCO7223504.1 GNAT family N-acetyltransferase [Pleionea sp. CnH1-48]